MFSCNGEYIAEKVGITLANISVLKNGRAKAVRFSTLNEICRALSCQVGDLLEYVPDADIGVKIVDDGGEV